MKRLSLLALLIVVALSFGFLGCSKQEQKPADKPAQAAAPAAPKARIVFASDCTWPPMEFLTEKKEIVGLDIDLVKEMAAAANFDFEIKNTAWDGIFAGLENGQYDAVISSVTITDERKKTMDFSDPYFKCNQAVVVAAADKKTAKLEDLGGKFVGGQIGTTGVMEIQKNKALKLKSYDEVGLAFEDLVNGRIAGVVCDTPTAAQYALQNDKYKAKLRVVGEIATDEYYGIAVKKGKTDALALINAGIKKVKESGKLDEMKKKWIP